MVASLNREIKYGSKEHQLVLDRVRSRYKMSRDEMTKRWPTWRKLLKEEKAFLDTKDMARKERSRKDNDLEIKIPFSWAMQQTSLMYLSSVFLNRAPLMQYTGRHGEGQDKVLGMEALIDYQVQVGEMTPDLYAWMSDALSLGLGVVGEYWEDETVRARRIVERPATINGIPIPGKTEKAEEFVEIPGYSGNKVFCVRPFDYFPDPRVTLRNVQKGEFVGRLADVGFHEIQAREANGEYFNVGVLKSKLRNGGGYDSNTRERVDLNDGIETPDNGLDMYGSDDDAGSKNPDILEMCIKIIPKDWGFNDSKYPEIWVFTVANNEVVIGCRPLGLFHDRFPFHVLQYEIDGHHVHTRSMNEIIKPMNDVMTWMFNSHVYNVRKTINNELVVDPSRINMKDFERTGPGRLLRLKPAAYGTDPRQAIHQLNMNDVTRQNLNDIAQVKNLMQMIVGVNDSLMGALSGGGRKTATEVRTSSTFGINRLKTVAEYFSATGFQSLSRNLVASTQQLYTGDKMFKIAGNSINGPEFTQVTPETIAGFYDFVPVDGTMPVDRMMQANLFKEMLMGAGKMGPQFLAQYDIGKIFEHILKLNGIKNVDAFKVQVVPDQQLRADAAAGNVVPMAGSSMGANPGEGNVVPGSPQDVGAS